MDTFTNAYPNNWNNSTSVLNLGEVLEKMAQLEARDNLRKSRAEFDFLAADPCPACGRKMVYHEGPPERIVLCRCMLKQLKKVCEPRTETSPVHPFQGMLIEVFKD